MPNVPVVEADAVTYWSVEFFGRLVPRHLEIVYEINRRFLDEMRVH